MENNTFMSVFSQFFIICQDKIEEKGEDSFLYNVNSNAAIIGVFDGCGGSGGRRYEEFENKTGAYIASRVVSEAVNNWFVSWCEEKKSTAKDKDVAENLKKEIDWKLSNYNNQVKRASKLKGNIQKDFPTTAAICILRYNSVKNMVFANVLWSGDSRGYWIDDSGLHQLTKDDVEGEDAMSNIYNDGVLTNIISASEPYDLREYCIPEVKKGIVFVATDGCFGYLPSPMHFEYLILDTLLNSQSIVEWEEKLRNEIMKYTGDDATICGIILGFENFFELKKYYQNRYYLLKKEYIDSFVKDENYNNNSLWSKYQIEYKRILEENVE